VLTPSCSQAWLLALMLGMAVGCENTAVPAAVPLATPRPPQIDRPLPSSLADFEGELRLLAGEVEPVTTGGVTEARRLAACIRLQRLVDPLPSVTGGQAGLPAPARVTEALKVAARSCPTEPALTGRRLRAAAASLG
jgi:hypothetical protein